MCAAHLWPALDVGWDLTLAPEADAVHFVNRAPHALLVWVLAICSTQGLFRFVWPNVWQGSKCK